MSLGHHTIQVVPEEWLPPSDIAKTQRVRDLEKVVSTLPNRANGLLGFAENEQLSTSVYQQSFTGRNLVIGQVVYTHPGAYWYRVRLDQGGGEVSCCSLSQTPFRPLGVKDCSQIPAASRVLVYSPIELPFGIIMGCLPHIKDGPVGYGDWVGQGSSVGSLRETYYSSIPSIFANNGNIINFSNSRPIDTLAVGEWGQINDLGGGFFLDPMMAFMRVDELAGLWMFHMDRLTRLCGYNYDFRSSISEEMIRNDDGEGLHYSGYTPYPWEALGILTHGDKGYNDSTPDEEVMRTALNAKIEPAFREQQPIYRLEEYRGYLGQAYMRTVQVPVRQDSGGPNLYSSGPGLGVFREQLGLDGSYSVFSAHSMHIGKRALIPVPKRIKPPEDPTGDDLAKSSGYKPAGLYGSGKEHKIADSRASESAAWSPANLLDALAYTTNWKGYHPFYYHINDFEPLTEDVLVQTPLDFSKLREDQFLPLPEPREVTIDHRHVAKFYELLSCVSFLPDGGLVIRGGGGCEIRMSGGTIQTSSPGDIITQSGRSTITYAGDDLISRAHNSIDLTAANKDFRAKAENNMDLLAANSGSGRLLLDCHAEGIQNDVVNKQGEDVLQNGIILTSQDTDISVVSGNNLYLRTVEGQITLDAAKGQNAIETISSSVNHFTNLVSMVYSGENVTAVHAFGPNGVEIQAGISAKGPMILSEGGLVVNGNVIAVDGETGKLTPESPDYGLAKSQFSEIKEEFLNVNKEFREGYQRLAEVWYADGSIGTDEVIENTQFAPRTAKQMSSEKFQLPENYWQQLAHTGATWHEPTIAYQGLDMMPHPGLENWDTKQTFLRMSPKLHNVSTGKDKKPGSDYEDYQPGDFEPAKLSESYLIIGN
jgi:hypothetical protein